MTVNVVDDFGADFTGKSDCSDAFVAAITAVESRGGGIIDIPAGEYWINEAAPLTLKGTVHFRGSGGIVETFPPTRAFGGSMTTLVFPADKDGFFVYPEARAARFENFALVRKRDTGPNPPRFARRGIWATRPIWANDLYFVNWMRGIDLDGRTAHPEYTDTRAAFAVNSSYVSRIYAEDCFWVTYTHGNDSQGGLFEHISSKDCGAGIYDSSSGGNTYVGCYIQGGASQNGSISGPPYYAEKDSASVFLDCHCESVTVPQLGNQVLFVGGNVNAGSGGSKFPTPLYVKARLGVLLGLSGGVQVPFRGIIGIPDKMVGSPFRSASFGDAGEKIDLTVDGVKRTITLKGSNLSPGDVANQINASFKDLDKNNPYPDKPDRHLPRVATADGFDFVLTLQAWRGFATGRAASSIDLEGEPDTLKKIGSPQKVSGLPQSPCQLVSPNQNWNGIFRGFSPYPPSKSVTQTEYDKTPQIEVQIAPAGDVAMLWQERGGDGDPNHFQIRHERVTLDDQENNPSHDPKKVRRRWVIEHAESQTGKILAFTAFSDDALGTDQVLSYGGFWLYDDSERKPAVLLSNGKPGPKQGRVGDLAWDVSAKPIKQYQKSDAGWKPTETANSED